MHPPDSLATFRLDGKSCIVTGAALRVDGGYTTGK
jgi:hypothetical protein